MRQVLQYLIHQLPFYHKKHDRRTHQTDAQSHHAMIKPAMNKAMRVTHR